CGGPPGSPARREPAARWRRRSASRTRRRRRGGSRYVAWRNVGVRTLRITEDRAAGFQPCFTKTVWRNTMSCIQRRSAMLRDRIAGKGRTLRLSALAVLLTTGIAAGLTAGQAEPKQPAKARAQQPSDTAKGESYSGPGSLSADGRYFVFLSKA